MKRFYRFELALLAIGVVCVGYFAAQRKGIDFLDWIGLGEEIVVQTTQVESESRAVVVILRGELRPLREVDVVSQLAGSLAELRVKVGDPVTAGAVVATVYSGELDARTGEIDAGLSAARRELKDKEELLAGVEKRRDGIRELYRQDLVARRDLEQAEQAAVTGRAQFELAQARLAQQEALLTQIQKLQHLTLLNAPMAGVVIRRALGPGAAVNETRVVLTVAQIDPLRLIAEIPESFSDRIRPGMAVQIADRKWRELLGAGKITRVESKAVEGERILEVESQFANRRGAFDFGMAVEAKVTLAQQEKVLLIPRAAVQSQPRSPYVYKVANGRAVRQEVKLDDLGEERVVIRVGLIEGDLVVSDRFDALRDGLRVRVVPTR